MGTSRNSSSVCWSLSEMLLIGLVVLVSTACVVVGRERLGSRMGSSIDEEEDDEEEEGGYEFFSGSDGGSGDRATTTSLLQVSISSKKDSDINIKATAASSELHNNERPEKSNDSAMMIGLVVGCIAIVTVVVVIIVVVVKRRRRLSSLRTGRGQPSTDNRYEVGRSANYQSANEYYTKIRPTNSERSSASNSSTSHGSSHPIYDEI